MSPAITPNWLFPETDRSAFRSKVLACLGDRRIAGYFARNLVQHDDVTQALLTGDAVVQAVSRNSYQPYFNARKVLKGRLGQNADILDEGALNGRTILICALVVLLALGLLITFCVGHFATFGIMLGAVLSAALSARLFGKARIEPRRRPRRFAFSLLTFSVSLCIVILPHLYLRLQWTSFSLYLSWIVAFIAGYQLHDPQTAGEFKDLLTFGSNYLLLPFEKYEYSRRKREWLDDCIETVIIPNAVLAINTALGEDKDLLLVEQDSEGLRKLQDPSFTVPTSSESRIASILSQMDGGSIALAGPRGAGKSTLLKKFSSPLSKERINAPISVYLAAPAEYVPRDFIADLFQRLCETYLNRAGCPLPRPIYKERPTFKFRQAFGRAFGTLWLILRAAIALGIITWLVWPFIKATYPHVYLSSRDTYAHWYNISYQHIHVWWAHYKGWCEISLVFLALILFPAPRLWKNYIRPKKEPPLAKQAREYLRRLQIDKTVTWGATLTSPRIRGVTFSASRGGTASYTPWTLPELVGYTRLFLENIAKQFPRANHAVVVGIDEIDRIGSLDHAERFIGEIKAVFGIERCFFMVAVAEDVGSVFAQRATAGRSILENAFDDIIVVEPLNFEETRDLLLKRVPGFTDSFVYLVYALSGGLPRELIRVTRRLVEVNQELIVGHQPRLQDLAFILVKENLIESIRVTRAQISRLTLHANWAELFKILRSASTELRSTSFSSTHQSRQTIEGLSELKAPSPVDGEIAANITSDDEENASRIIQNFSAYAYFGSTVIDAFSDKFFDLQIVQQYTTSASQTTYEELALARAELSVSSASSRAMLSRFRNSLRPREARPDVAVNDLSLPVPSRHSGRVPDSGDLLSCSFCGKSQKHVKKLIAGPGVYICDLCISGAHAVIAEPGQTASTPIATTQQVSDERGKERCSFCGKHRYEVAGVAAADDARICNECLELCDEILSEEPPVPSR